MISFKESRIINSTFLRILAILIASLTQLNGQGIFPGSNSIGCGENEIVETYVLGMLDNPDNCISITNTNDMTSALIEVWVQDRTCGGNFPSTLELTTNTGNLYTLAPFDIAQSSSGANERIYRVEIFEIINEVCITNLGGCNDVISMTAFVARDVGGTASNLVTIDHELEEDECLTETINIIGDAAPEYEFDIPVHEKNNNGAVYLEVRALDNGVVVDTDAQTYTAQNAGAEASLFNMFLNNLPPTVDQLEIMLCSPLNGGGSLGLGSIIFTSTTCSPVVCDLSCETEVIEYVGCNCTDDGIAIVNTTGGTGPYTYSWSNGSSSQTVHGLSEGTYSVTVTDSNDCHTTCVIEMEEDPSCCRIIRSNGFLTNFARG